MQAVKGFFMEEEGDAQPGFFNGVFLKRIVHPGIRAPFGEFFPAFRPQRFGDFIPVDSGEILIQLIQFFIHGHLPEQLLDPPVYEGLCIGMYQHKDPSFLFVPSIAE